STFPEVALELQRTYTSRNRQVFTFFFTAFSCSRKPGEEECKSLTVPGRVAALQLACHFRKCKPCRDFPPLCKAPPQFSSRKVERTRPRRDFVLGEISILIFEVDHHVKRDHVDAEFVFMGPE